MSAAPEASHTHWKTLTLAALACTGVSLIYWQSLGDLITVLTTDNHRHGFLVLATSIWLLWRNRHRYDDAAISGSFLGVLLVLGTVWVWVVARISLVGSLEQLALLVLYGATTLAAVGWRSFRPMLFPFCFLLLAFPLGDSMIPSLMQITADVAEALLHATGQTFYRDGSTFVLPGGSFEIADVCAGLGHLLAGITIGTLFAYLTFRKLASQVLFVLATAGVLILENGVRAYLVITISSANISYYEHHITFGWVLFGITVLAVMWAGQWAARRER